MLELTSLFSGSILGIFGSLGSSVVELIKEGKRFKHELAMLDKQKELALVAATNQVQIEALKVLASSYEADKANYSLPELSYVDQVRGLVRPIITAYLTLTTSGIAIYCVTKIGWGTILMDRVAEYTVYSSFELLGVCIGWWFGSRGMDKLRGVKR